MNCTRVYKNCNLMITVLLTLYLFSYHKNVKKTKGCVWGITTRAIKPMKFHTKSKIKGWRYNWWAASPCITKVWRKPRMLRIWGMTTRTMKSMKVCKKAWESECSSDSDIDEVSLINRSCHLATGYSPPRRVLNLDQKNHGKVSAAVIVMPLSRRGFINEQRLLPP